MSNPRRSSREAVRRNAYWRMFGMGLAFLASGVAITTLALIRMISERSNEHSS